MAEALKLTGDLETANLLRELPARVEKKGTRAAMTAASVPVKKALRRLMPRESGTAKRAVTSKVKTYKSGNVAAIIGAGKTVTGTYKGKQRVPFYYLHLIEQGAAAHAIPQKRGGVIQHPGSPARHVLDAAYKSSRDQARQIAEAKLAAVVLREAEKLGAK